MRSMEPRGPGRLGSQTFSHQEVKGTPSLALSKPLATSHHPDFKMGKRRPWRVSPAASSVGKANERTHGCSIPGKAGWLTGNHPRQYWRTTGDLHKSTSVTWSPCFGRGCHRPGDSLQVGELHIRAARCKRRHGRLRAWTAGLGVDSARVRKGCAWRRPGARL
ncbi:uncharacterized protein B0I36DRAFT_311430 [Microdochium trichocladiopsis]|uniref:Uncharacterized protein n=1 Tax=Microdochium trichocladiopsis TaxID=1682393 RepID=A0A9P9BWN4_9PEZI|nr:uncharacterized protein B0I36DRAFT_311430 [Microdochium trichocladiopsis]KAH7040770.1 hypothetical protein B0I36DRAFT_311430 [Microdochium trichocladiopsis]